MARRRQNNHRHGIIVRVTVPFMVRQSLLSVVKATGLVYGTLIVELMEHAKKTGFRPSRWRGVWRDMVDHCVDPMENGFPELFDIELTPPPKRGISVIGDGPSEEGANGGARQRPGKAELRGVGRFSRLHGEPE